MPKIINFIGIFLMMSIFSCGVFYGAFAFFNMDIRFWHWAEVSRGVFAFTATSCIFASAIFSLFAAFPDDEKTGDRIGRVKMKCFYAGCIHVTESSLLSGRIPRVCKKCDGVSNYIEKPRN
jgi:hypothetical protein